jgi:calcyclin binding protein
MLSEIDQTRSFLDQAAYPGLKDVLSKYLADLEKSEAALKPPEPPAVESSAEQLVGSAAAEETKEQTKPVVAPPTAPPKAPIVGNYIPIDSFAWDQGGYNSDTVSIFIDLPGVGAVKQNCKINFRQTSFDLTVTELNGKNYRLVKDNLEKDIVPESSKMIVKANKIVLKLAKVKGEYSYDHWNNLTAKKPRGADSGTKKDPMGGIMDMMKDMYEDGDDNMRKIIGEAMLKSQNGEKPTAPGMDDL